MALREILTYQGASAGILMPEVSCHNPTASNLKAEDNDVTVKRENNDASIKREDNDTSIKQEDNDTGIKREREIDLNLQVPLDESEPILKRPKIEDAGFPISESSNADLEVCLKVNEEDLITSTSAIGEVDIDARKVESQSDIGGACHSISDATEAKESTEGNESVEKMDMLKTLTQNTELMNFVKDARNSWLRNCEFLQECAIRFLCVLSLDRYGILYNH